MFQSDHSLPPLHNQTNLLHHTMILNGIIMHFGVGGIGNICAEPFSLPLMGVVNAAQCLVMALYGHKSKDFLEKVLHVGFLNVDACPLYNQFA